MTDTSPSRASARRSRAEGEILDAAWAQMASQGVAALNVREVARSVGLRQQSLTYYYPTKQDLLDALFADGFGDLSKVFDEAPEPTDVVEAFVVLTEAFVDYCVANPARYHLMFQGTIPGFQPSERSHDVALSALSSLIERLAAAGITAEADIALVRCLMSGLAAEQIANDPGGRLFADQTRRGIRALLEAIRQEHERGPQPKSRSTSKPKPQRRPARGAAST